MKKHLSVIVLGLVSFQLIGCGKSDEQVAKERTDSVMAVRTHVYGAAQKLVRDLLYVPSSAKFPAVSSQNTDSLSINIDSGHAIVISYVESQNRMGVYLRPDKFRAILTGKDSTWKGNVDLPYYDNPGGVTSSNGVPPPPPPPDTAMH
jgi:hypothetical protein